MKLYYEKNLIEYAKKMRNHPTHAENALWNILKQNAIGYDFHRQKPLGKFIFDFYCFNLKLLIEVDGASHFESDTIGNDTAKDIFAKSIEFNLIRFTDEDVLGRANYVETVIRNYISGCANTTHRPPPLDRGGEGLYLINALLTRETFGSFCHL